MKMFNAVMLIGCLSICGCTTSENLKDPEVIGTVNYEMDGCFGSMQATIRLNRRDSIVLAELMVDGRERRVAKMDYVRMKEFETFINELKKVGIGGCTTEERYDVTYKGERIIRSDGKCEWDGFSKLTQSLFESP